MTGYTGSEPQAGILQYDLSPRIKATVIGGTMLGLFVSAINQTIVSTALPRIIAELGGISVFAWVFTRFLLTSTTVMPVVGRLSNLYGRQPVSAAANEPRR